MIEDLLELATVFDWISPTLSIAGDIVNGGGTTFMIPQDCGWTGGEIADKLHSHGVRTWGHMIVNGTIMITVPPAQAEFARYVLQRAGVPTGAEPQRGHQQRPESGKVRSGGLGGIFNSGWKFGV